MNNESYILGIDTSNYKTSVAVINQQGEIVCDLRRLLSIKPGDRGLRQSDALFQHIETFPSLIEQVFKADWCEKIKGIACSDRPRPVEGSYMPVFKAGQSFARTLASALHVPLYFFSHQEGHIAAIKHYSSLKDQASFLCYHLSGGTSELLKVGQDIEIIGGSKDISFGQLIDRIGVAMGMDFPAGEEMDKRACFAKSVSSKLKRISSDGLYFNLSGIETQCSRVKTETPDDLIRELFDRISELLIRITDQAVKDTQIDQVMFTGGVASSQYISNKIKMHFAKQNITTEFGRQTLSQDNAVGIALLGGKEVWQ